MTVVEFVRSETSLVDAPAGFPQCADVCEAANRLRIYGRAMRLCFIFILAVWGILQIGCLLSLLLHFRSGIVAGTIDGTVAFKFWPVIDYFSPNHALSNAFLPHVFSLRVVIGYAVVLTIASAPFCASLLLLAKLFDLYSHGVVFTQQNARVMRRIGHSIMATGYSPLLLGPVAHAIGVLKPVSGITDAMIAFIVLGLILLAISDVMEVGQRMRQEQEDIL